MAKKQNQGYNAGYEKKRSEKQRRKERYSHLNAEFQRIPGGIRKPSSVINAKK